MAQRKKKRHPAVAGRWRACRGALLLRQYADRWIAAYEVNRKSTVRMARTHLKHILDAFGDVELGEIAPTEDQDLAGEAEARRLQGLLSVRLALPAVADYDRRGAGWSAAAQPVLQPDVTASREAEALRRLHRAGLGAL